jgi:hypothetical protein
MAKSSKTRTAANKSTPWCAVGGLDGDRPVARPVDAIAPARHPSHLASVIVGDQVDEFRPRCWKNQSRRRRRNKIAFALHVTFPHLERFARRLCTCRQYAGFLGQLSGASEAQIKVGSRFGKRRIARSLRCFQRSSSANIWDGQCGSPNYCQRRDRSVCDGGPTRQTGHTSPTGLCRLLRSRLLLFSAASERSFARCEAKRCPAASLESASSVLLPRPA